MALPLSELAVSAESRPNSRPLWREVRWLWPWHAPKSTSRRSNDGHGGLWREALDQAKWRGRWDDSLLLRECNIEEAGSLYALGKTRYDQQRTPAPFVSTSEMPKPKLERVVPRIFRGRHAMLLITHTLVDMGHNVVNAGGPNDKVEWTGKTARTVTQGRLLAGCDDICREVFGVDLELFGIDLHWFCSSAYGDAFCCKLLCHARARNATRDGGGGVRGHLQAPAACEGGFGRESGSHPPPTPAALQGQGQGPYPLAGRPFVVQAGGRLASNPSQVQPDPAPAATLFDSSDRPKMSAFHEGRMVSMWASAPPAGPAPHAGPSAFAAPAVKVPPPSSRRAPQFRPARLRCRWPISSARQPGRLRPSLTRASRTVSHRLSPCPPGLALVPSPRAPMAMSRWR